MSEASGGQEETPHVRGQGRLGEATSCKARSGDPEEPSRARGQGPQLGGATHARGQGRQLGEATQGVVAAQAKEGLEELSHVEGQERWR